jgi:hypothetical protein
MTRSAERSLATSSLIRPNRLERLRSGETRMKLGLGARSRKRYHSRSACQQNPRRQIRYSWDAVARGQNFEEALIANHA